MNVGLRSVLKKSKSSKINLPN